MSQSRCDDNGSASGAESGKHVARTRKEAVCPGVCSSRNTEFEILVKTCAREWMEARS